jgi:peptidoglycan/LPS O-acetylase OafA/YrhL
MLIPVFVCAIRFRDTLLFKILNFRILRFVGSISYSAYLVHYLIIEVFLPVKSVFKYPLIVLITLIYATIMFYLVEAPLRKVARRFSPYMTPDNQVRQTLKQEMV